MDEFSLKYSSLHYTDTVKSFDKMLRCISDRYLKYKCGQLTYLLHFVLISTVIFDKHLKTFVKSAPENNNGENLAILLEQERHTMKNE